MTDWGPRLAGHQPRGGPREASGSDNRQELLLNVREEKSHQRNPLTAPIGHLKILWCSHLSGLVKHRFSRGPQRATVRAIHTHYTRWPRAPMAPKVSTICRWCTRAVLMATCPD